MESIPNRTTKIASMHFYPPSICVRWIGFFAFLIGAFGTGAAFAETYPVTVKTVRFGLPPGPFVTQKDENNQPNNLFKAGAWAPIQIWLDYDLAAPLSDEEMEIICRHAGRRRRNQRSVLSIPRAERWAAGRNSPSTRFLLETRQCLFHDQRSCRRRIEPQTCSPSRISSESWACRRRATCCSAPVPRLRACACRN